MRHDQTRQNIEAFLPIAVLAILLLLAFNTLVPFLPAILWGVILSVALAPAHARLARALGGRRLAATWIVALLLALLLFLPMVGFSRAFLAFLPDVLAWLELDPQEMTAGLNPGTADPADLGALVRQDIDAIRAHFSEEIRPLVFWALSEVKLFGSFLIEFALGLVLACVLLHRSRDLSPLIERLTLRVGGSFAVDMLAHAANTTRSAVLGMLGSALAQTAVACVAYIASGVPHWGILAGLTFLLGMVQIGPVLIWGPIAAWLWLDGQIGMAVFVAVWGLVAVGLTDNVVKAMVLSRSSHMPALLAFLGAVGGLLTWGIVGVFLGPVIVAVSHQLLLRWLEAEASAPRDEDGPADAP